MENELNNTPRYIYLSQKKLSEFKYFCTIFKKTKAVKLLNQETEFINEMIY